MNAADPARLPCPVCSGTGTDTHEDRHTETNQDTCRTCGGTGKIAARTGEGPEASFIPAPHPLALMADNHVDHEFKSHPDVFWPAARGEKTFEFRKDDRGGYQVGQTVRIRCYDPDHGYYGHPPLDRVITNVLYPGQFGLQDGYCILSLRPLNAAAAILLTAPVNQNTTATTGNDFPKTGMSFPGSENGSRTALTEAGQKVFDVLVKARAVPPSWIYWPGHAAALNAAAEILMPAEEAGLREAAGRPAYVPDDLTGPSRLEWMVGFYSLHVPAGVCDRLLDLAHEWRAALASPQPAVEGPVAAGVSDEAVEAASAAFYDTMIGPEEKFWPHHEGWAGKDEAFKTGVRGRMRTALEAATLTPPADPKPTVPGNDAGMREANDHTRKAVARAMDEDGGWWKSCSGCHETNEGHETGHYPYSELFRCHVGAGCSECGGLGVVWEYYSDEAFAAMAEELAPQTGSAGEDEAEKCFVCDISFKPGDMVINDITEGTMHRECCGPERESFVGADDEPLGPDEPLPAGYPWKPEASTVSAGEDPKTPDAGVGVRDALKEITEAPASLEVYSTLVRGALRKAEVVLAYHASMARPSGDELPALNAVRDALAALAPVGEDETVVREAGAVDPALYWMKKWGDLMVAYDTLAANQPPKAETPAGVGDEKWRESLREGFEAWIKGFGFPTRRRGGGSYENPHTGIAWNAWHAAYKNAALSAAPAARPGNEVERVLPTDALVDRFAAALKTKLRASEAKYGWQNGWLKPDWRADCQRDLVRHVAKGDPLDVAAYAAFCWHHGWSTATIDYQSRVSDWVREISKDDPFDLPEHRDRFVEEALELAQSLGQSADDARALVDYVFDRPVGEPHQEMGGTMVTLAKLASAAGLDMAEAGDAELGRCWRPEVLEKIRRKRLTRHGRGPLPGISPAVAPAANGGRA